MFDNSTHQLIGAVRVFRTQAIHGIHVHGVVGNNAAESAVPYVLVWGGRSVCCIRLEPIIAGSQGRSHIQFRPLVLETHLTDWIFDACFLSTQPDVDATHIDAVVLTAHNILLFLNVPVLLNECSARKYVMNEAAAGPRSILYSGHVILLASGKVLVAAGTAFGELLLWSCKVEEAPSVSWQMKSRLLHYTFLGHEGSIFGVRISDGFPLPGSDTVQRILASCSDDRTIRIWDISDVTNGTPIDWQEDMATTPVETGFTTSDSHANQVSSSLLAVAMGHLSRIWGVRFLSRRGPIQQLVSYGEDASLQLWEIDLTNSLRSSSKMPEIPLGVLRHLDTYKFHSGKHIWSVALFADPNGAWKISTGGADGCITHYNMPLQNKCGRLWSMSDIWDKCVGSARDLNSSTVSTVARSSAICATKATFTALEGKWILKRTIESALPLYPSGIFEGSAIFQKRTPTDPEYDMEFLYVEEGEFATKQGLTLSGSRRYVYRYQAITDVITAWFVNVDDKTSVDYYFHNLNFPDTESGVPRLSRWGASSSTATGYHLCKKDDYWIYYIFSFDGANLRNLNLQYKVNGPVKDYMADASYTRPDNVNHQSKPAYDSVNAAHRAQNAGNTSTELQRPDLGSQDSFKSYAWVSDVEFLTTTDQGHILLGSLQDTNQLPTQGFENRDSSLVVSWERLTHLDHLKSYCLATSVEEDGMAFLSGTEGTIYLYQHCGRSISPLITLPRKISGLFAQALDQRTDPLQPLSSLSHIGMVASCLGSTTANAIILVVNPSGPEESRYSIVREITLILPSNFIVTSGGFACLQKLVVLGSRDGALALYDFSPFSDDETGIVVSCCVRYVHGEEAVTAIKNVPLAWPAADTSSGYVLTTGRDGRYAVHQWNLEPALQASKLTLETVLVGSPSFGPNIEGAAFQPSTQELLLWGFRSKHFVVWNHTERREVMAIECGGTHRSWSFSPGLKNLGSRMSLVWTKASTCYIDSRPRASHGVLQDGGHGREIKAMAISLSKYDDGGVCSRLVATGAEDTAIRIFSYKGLNSDVKGSSLQCIGTFAKHTAGLQQLQWSKAGHYLFSAAGCEEFYIWRVQPLPLFGIGVVCDARCPVKSDSADLRIMDFDVVDIRGEGKESAKIKHRFLITMVYSDSSLRVSVAIPLSDACRLTCIDILL